VAAAGRDDDEATAPPEEPDSRVSQPAPAKVTKSKSTIVSSDFGSIHFSLAGVLIFKL
jgi:hypothetical protein